VKVSHLFLGPDVDVRLWSPSDGAEVPKAASGLTADVISSTAKSAYGDPVLSLVKKQSPDPVPATESFPDYSRTDDGKSRNYLEQKASVDDSQSQTGVQAVRTRHTLQPRQVSDVGNSRNSLTSHSSVVINADSKVQFYLLKELLENGFAREHRCDFRLDANKWEVTLSSKHQEYINLLGEQLYEYKNSGTSEAEADLSPGLSRVLYDKHRQWLYDGLRRHVNDPVHLVMGNGSDSRLAVVAFSQNAAEEGAKKLGACLLRGKIPLTDFQHVLASSAKFHKQFKKIMMNKAIDVKTDAREIIVDGLPHDVVCTVSEINRYLNKK